MLNSTSRTYDSATIASLLAGFKQSLRITATDMDSELTRELKASALHCENYVGYVLVKSSFVFSCSFAPKIALRGPVLTVTSVTVDGEVLESDEYTVEGDEVLIHTQQVWGSQVVVEYTAGLPQIPEDIEQALFLRAGYFFNSPVDSVDKLQRASTVLLRPHRLFEA